MTAPSILRFKIGQFICVGTSRKAGIVTFCFKIIYGIYLLHTSVIIKTVNISDRPVRVLPHLYILLSPGIMDISVQFEGDITYAKLDIPEVRNNIPDDLRRSVCSKSKSKATPFDKVTKEGVYYKQNTVICLDLCV